MSFNLTNLKSSVEEDDMAIADILDCNKSSDDSDLKAAVNNDAVNFDNEVTSDSEHSSLSQFLYDNLKLNNFEAALKLLKGVEYERYVKYNSLDIVPIILTVMREDFCTSDTEYCIEEMLDYIALIADKKEALIVFLEEAELFRGSKQFRVLVKPFQTILMQEISPSAKTSAFSWIFFAVNKHASVLPFPKYKFLEADERKLLDADPKYIFIVDTYSYLLDFYYLFFGKVISKELAWPEKNIISEVYFSYYLLNLFDKPMAFLDVYKSESDVDNTLYRICEKYVNMISLLIKNPCKYFELIKCNNEPSHQLEKNKDEDSEEDGFAPTQSVSQLSLGVYFYFILGQSMNSVALPCVYTAEFMYSSCILLCLHMIKKNGIFTIHKGLVLLDSLLNRLDNDLLSVHRLDDSNHLNTYKFLVDVMKICDSRECRILALKCFKEWIRKFENEGKYRLFITIFATVPHSGIQGVLIHEIKENIRILLAADLKDDNFSGHKLQNLLYLACTLPEGERTDLFEWSDKITAALNLLIYICIRDQSDVLSFKPIIPLLFRDFLEPLAKGLRITKGHYKLKLKDLEEGKYDTEYDFNIKISGESITRIPEEKQKEIVLQCLNCFDVIHSIWARAIKVVTNFKNANSSAEVN